MLFKHTKLLLFEKLICFKVCFILIDYIIYFNSNIYYILNINVSFHTVYLEDNKNSFVLKV